MFYILYQVTNNLNGKIYVGVHKTKNLDDGYMGSGKVINSAIKKYGIENFTRVILEQFEDSTAMFAREKEVVTEEFLAREDTYNLRRGGFGGFDYINAKSLNVNFDWVNYNNTPAHRESSMRGFHASFGKDASLRHSFTKEEAEIERSKAQTPEAKAKRKETFAAICHQQGEKNSQFGTKWATDGTIDIRLKAGEDFPAGWVSGKASALRTEISRLANATARAKAKDIKTAAMQQQHTEWYAIYNAVGFARFVEQTGYTKSQANLVMRFAKYVDSFVPQHGKQRSK